MFSNWEGGLYRSHKSTYIFSSLFIVKIILLFLLMTQVNLFSRYGVYSLSSTSLSLIISTLNCCIEPKSSISIFWGLFPELPEFSEFTNTFIKLYFFVRPKSILSTSLKVLITHTLLMWVSCQWQKQMRLFLLMRWMS